MKENDILTIKIDDIGMNGEGIGHTEGYTLFIPFSLVDETVVVRITHVKKSLAYGVLKSIIHPSPYRKISECPYFSKCGGCDYLHLDYLKQLDYKKNALSLSLNKSITNLSLKIDDVIPSQKILYYRNKIQLPFGVHNKVAVLGFFQEKTHQVVPIKNCILHGDWAEKLILLVLAFVIKTKQTIFNEKTASGTMRYLIGRYIDNILSVTLVINADYLKQIDILVESLKSAFGPFTTLHLSINKKQNNIVLGDKTIDILGKKQMITISGISLELSPNSFFQVNDYIREKLYDKIIKNILLTENPIVIDAFGGVGLLGAMLAKANARVYTIEIMPDAVLDSKKMFKLNNIEAEHLLGDTSVKLPLLLTQLINSGVKTINLILDPPRKGISDVLISSLLKIKNISLSIYYISCNPATLSRDLALLLPTYSIEFITPFDMFSQTRHLETLVKLNLYK